MRDYAMEHFHLPANRLVMLMNGIDLARFDPAAGARARAAIRGEWKIGDRQRLGLFVGNNWKLKGVREALQALAGLDPRLVLMIAGRDEPRPYRKIARRLGVADRVIFAGSVGDTRPLYGAADFLVLPTRRDTCSLVVLEALAMGLPVITTRQNGASEAMEDTRQGFLIERGDIAALADSMYAMLEDGLRREMAQQALAIRDSLSLQQHVSRIEGAYRRVMQHKSVTPRA
jgi:UDP-glucose:(heptosyl)LPS alpha-1,3-glucosyltransferase